MGGCSVMLTINALAASERLIIPVQTQYLSIKGVEQLLGTVARVKRNLNHGLRIDGVLLTMVDSRTNNSRDITNLLRETYGGKIHIFDAMIPRSVRAAEISAEGKSIFEHDPGGKVAQAYSAAGYGTLPAWQHPRCNIVVHHPGRRGSVRLCP